MTLSSLKKIGNEKYFPLETKKVNPLVYRLARVFWIHPAYAVLLVICLLWELAIQLEIWY